MDEWYSSIGTWLSEQYNSVVDWFVDKDDTSNWNLAVGGALLGSAVGGVAAAVTGGNVLKGVLVGGLTGGVGGYVMDANNTLNPKSSPGAIGGDAATDKTKTSSGTDNRMGFDLKSQLADLNRPKGLLETALPAGATLLGGMLQGQGAKEAAQYAAKNNTDNLKLQDQLLRERSRVTVAPPTPPKRATFTQPMKIDTTTLAPPVPLTRLEKPETRMSYRMSAV